MSRYPKLPMWVKSIFIKKDYPVVNVEGNGASMELPAFIQPQMPENVATIQFHQLDTKHADYGQPHR